MPAMQHKPATSLLLMLPAGILLAALPLLPRLPLPVVLLALLLGLWQLLIIHQQRKNPGRLTHLMILLASFAALVFSYGNLLGQQAGIALLILMSLLKLFETRTPRDVYIIVYSCFFIVASNFFQSQSIWLMAYVFAVIVFLFSSLIALSDRLHSLNLAARLKLSARFSLYALPFMLILFVLFPRIPGPLWGMPENAFTASTGLGEEMSPGSINHLISSDAVAFRVSFDTALPPQRQRYWRGVVLSRYDGKTWRRLDAPANARPHIIYNNDPSQTFDYTITLEPTHHNWLPTLETAEYNGNAYRLSREATLISRQKVTHAIKYRMRSQTRALNRSLYPAEFRKNLLLPVGKNPQTLTLAKQLMRASDYSAQRYITEVLRYFQSQHFIYTLNPDLLGEDAMDDFLFRSRRGFCEHYASAFAYLMRAAGIAARVVIGYQGGKMNPLDEYMIVRQSDAHAWVEIWFGTQAQGYWKRIDPTAAVSPDRIEHGVQSAGLEKNRLPLLLVSDNALFRNMAFLYDSLQNSWNQWVIGFDRQKQQNLLKALGLAGNLSSLVFLLVAGMTLAAVIITWLLLRQKNRERDPVQYYYQRFCRRLEKKGVVRKASEGPLDFERRVMRELKPAPAESGRLHFVFRAYRELHYGERDNARLRRHFIRAVKQF